MANNYLQFSEGIGDLTEEEHDWLKAELPRREETAFEDPDGPGTYFEWELNREELWLHSGECGDVEAVIELVQAFLKRFRPKACWGLTYAETCSKPRIGEFDGGAIFVTAEGDEYVNASHWVAERIAAFHEATEKP